MSLNSDLISQFVKATKDDKKTNKESTHLGTVKEYDGRTFVQLDGSELLTPVEQTTTVQEGNRVTVLIKDHTATITGNISSPSVGQGDLTQTEDQLREEIDQIIAGGSFSDEELQEIRDRLDELADGNLTLDGRLDATEAYIENLTAKDVEITGKLTANEAEIEYLKATKIDVDVLEANYAKIEDLEVVRLTANRIEADFGEFKDLYADDLYAVNAEIENLKAFNADIENLDSKYANIDFANIGEAAIKKIYSEVGIIDDLTMSEGRVTGTLVGVKIIGDLIEANTLKADTLIVEGEDGVYYKLNVSGNTVEAEQTDYNSISGSIITAQSITANKIAVDDLVAFGATIGGFNIDSDSLYSGVKESIDNTTRGIYLDNDGQVNIGDAYNYIKYYRDAEEEYNLEIAAKTVLFGIDRRDIASSIDEAKQATDTLRDETTERTNSVDADVQAKFAELYKYIKFSGETAITIGSGENAISLEVDNEKGIIFRKNGTPLGLWDGVDFYTGNIVVEVEERAQLGNFAFVPRSDGSLSFLRVGAPPMAFITQPKNTTVGITDDGGVELIELKCDVKGYNVTYQWQVLEFDDGTWTNVSDDSATTRVLTNATTALRAGTYRCAVANAQGGNAISNAAILTIDSGLKITTQPTGKSLHGGGTATLTVVAEGEGLTYQWYMRSNVGSTSFGKITSGTSATLTQTFGNSAATYEMKCVIADQYGAVVTTNIIKVTVSYKTSI